ncbi:MAG: T9SS C-terminal target domain-containing protein [Cytophagales bacterium]|nr:MAG: T9SS C-terminal target domain-containing protein [Cytophagales bacterium]
MKKQVTIFPFLKIGKIHWRTLAAAVSLICSSIAAQAGDVVWEIFKPKPGLDNVSTTTTTPTQTVVLTSLNAQGSLLGASIDDYQSRIKGFIQVAVTGNYTFAMASDDGAEFWLSTDAIPANKALLLKNNGFQGTLTTAANANRTFEAGKIYYFEVLHDEGSGGDFVQVAWNKPGDGANTFTDIPAANLMRFGMNFAPTLNAIIDPAPVNVSSGTQTINLSGISDGNAETAQNITITATSSNPAIVSNLVVNPANITNQTKASLSYTIGSQLGVAEITVTVKDDGDTAQPIGTDTYVVKFNVVVKNPVLNNSPIFGAPSAKKVNMGHEFVYIILPNVNDGDDNKDQNIAFTVENLNPTVLKGISVEYVKGNKFAVLKASPLTLGNASIKITAKDDGGIASGGIDSFTRTLDFNVGFFSFPGINFEYYDTQHWQELVDDATATPGSYQVIQTSTTPIRNLARDFFWQRMWGFITPSVTGEYIFRATGSDNNSLLYLSKDADPKNKVLISDFTGNKAPQNSDPIILTAGRTYYWMAKNADIVSSNEFDVFVAKPELGFTLIDGSLSSPVFDTISPTQPKNLKVITSGITDLLVEWDASTDKNFLGYLVYVDGVAAKDTVKGTSYKIVGLKENSSYSLVVVAVDKFENASAISNTINATTYGVDTNPPSIPTGLVLTKAYDLGLQIGWTPSTDAETEIRGYNIYLNGSETPVNSEIVKGASYQIDNLSNKTVYSIQIEAVDAAYNKSAKSVAIRFSTTDFNTSSTIPGVKKARVTFNMNAVATSTGVGIFANTDQDIMMRNKIPFPGFEYFNIKERKETSSNLVMVATNRTGTPADVYMGDRSARIQGGNGDYLRCNFGSQVNTDIFKYKVRFAVKRGATYNAQVGVRLTNTWGAVLLDTSFTPTASWALFETPLNRKYTDADAGMNLDITLRGSGSLFLDEIEFSEVNDEYMIDGKLSPYSKRGMEYMKELQPSAIRWGGLGTNFNNFIDAAGYRKNTFTLADWMNMANQVGAKTGISCGVYLERDWYKDSTTFTKFMDYLGGDASTAFGKRRIEEEGYTNLFDKSQGLIFEFGNEVWGGGCIIGDANCTGVNHASVQWAGKPLDYAIWCRKMAGMMKKSTGYQNYQSKIKTFYSGGFTDMAGFGGWNRRIYQVDKGEVDGIAIGGYMGGNLNYVPEVPRGQSELDYHRNTVAQMKTFWDQMFLMQRDMLRAANRVLPMYNYEGNMTRPDYQGRLGQAINFSDYYTGNMQKGAVSSIVFGLFNGGEWRILDGIAQKKLPMYHSITLFNKHCKGTALKTMVMSADSLTDDKNRIIKIEPIGAYSYAKGNKYSIVLYSRDFTSDYRVQLELPDSIKATKGYTIYKMTGNSFQSFDAVVDSVKNTTQTADSLLITVPKYGMVVVTFNANSYNLKAPEEGILVNNKKSTGIDAVSKTGTTTIPLANGSLDILVSILPEDVLLKAYRMTIVSNTANAQIVDNQNTSTVTVTDKGQNGTVTLRFTTLDGSTPATNFSKEITIQITGAVGVEDGNNSFGISIYPNPSLGNFQVNIPETVQGLSQIKVLSSNGSLVAESAGKIGINIFDISNLSKGIYVVKVIHESGTTTKRLTIL